MTDPSNVDLASFFPPYGLSQYIYWLAKFLKALFLVQSAKISKLKSQIRILFSSQSNECTPLAYAKCKQEGKCDFIFQQEQMVHTC